MIRRTLFYRNIRSKYPRLFQQRNNTDSKLPREEEKDEKSVGSVKDIPVEMDPKNNIGRRMIVLSTKKLDQLNYRRLLSPRALEYLFYPKDISFNGIQRYLNRKSIEFDVRKQSFNARRHGALGPDLACAHFVVYRNGKVKFTFSDKWFTSYEKLPTSLDTRYMLRQIDASGLTLYYESVDNFIALHELEELNISNNVNLDDFAADKMSSVLLRNKKLKLLDISGTSITDRGLGSLTRIPHLRKLIIRDTPAANFEHLELLLTEYNAVRPDCEIIY